jgi:hypothetical protein
VKRINKQELRTIHSCTYLVESDGAVETRRSGNNESSTRVNGEEVRDIVNTSVNAEPHARPFAMTGVQRKLA